MRLVLGVVGENAEPLGRDAQKAFGVEGGALGRSGACDWQLPDPTNTLSARHAVIAHNGAGFTITDTSTNGVYINIVDAPLGRGNTAPLADGDTLYIANYVISVSLEREPVDQRQQMGLTSNAARIGSAAKLHPPDFGATPPHLVANGSALPGAELAVPLDPLAGFDSRAPGVAPQVRRDLPPPAPLPLPDPLQMLDDRPANDFLTPSPAVPLSSPARPSAPPGLQPDIEHALGQLAGRPRDAGLPLSPLAPQVAQPHANPAAIIPEDFNVQDLLSSKPAPPPPRRSPGPQPAPPSLGPALGANLVEVRPPGAAAPMPGERVLDPLAVLKQRAAERAVPPPAAVAPLPGGMPSGDELAALWQALGFDRQTVPPERRQEAVTELGQALREMASGLHSVLAARALMKNELHIEQTRIRSGDNNAFKFMKSGDEALRKSLFKDGGYLPLSRSVREGFQDIKAHEVAAMVAMRAVIANLLAQVSPEALAGQDTGSGLFGRDKGRMWDRFVELHGSLVSDIDRTIRGLIADEFTQSYDAHLAKVRTEEKAPA